MLRTLPPDQLPPGRVPIRYEPEEATVLLSLLSGISLLGLLTSENSKALPLPAARVLRAEPRQFVRLLCKRSKFLSITHNSGASLIGY
jgi:hypothetical protein